MIPKTAIALAGVGAGLMVCSEYEKRHFVTEQYSICSEKLCGRTDLVFLTDLHNNEFGPDNRDLLAAISRIHPDAVLIGGDMMVCKGKRDVKTALSLVRRLARRWPLYYAEGNHEERMHREREVYGTLYDEYRQALEKEGVIWLADAGADFGSRIHITGCNLDEKYYRHRFTVPVLPEGEIRRRVGRPDPEKFQILLFHSPLFFGNCRRWGADLTLSGHFHGGTIRIPGLGGVMTPQYQFFLPWCAGRFDREAKTMIVGRGLGTHSVNIRLNNRPQLVHLVLEGRKGR